MDEVVAFPHGERLRDALECCRSRVGPDRVDGVKTVSLRESDKGVRRCAIRIDLDGLPEALERQGVLPAGLLMEPAPLQVAVIGREVGLRRTVSTRAPCNRTGSSLTMVWVISSWRSKMSSSSRSYRSAQTWFPLAASMSCAVMRIRLPAFLTEPSTR